MFKISYKYLCFVIFVLDFVLFVEFIKINIVV